MSEVQNNENQDSAPTVSLRFLLDLNDVNNPQVTSTKCTTCNQVGPHQWFKIGPSPVGPVPDPLAIMQMYKRVTMCQNCGVIKVTK